MVKSAESLLVCGGIATSVKSNCSRAMLTYFIGGQVPARPQPEITTYYYRDLAKQS